MKKLQLIPVVILLLASCKTQENKTTEGTPSPTNTTVSSTAIVYTDSAVDKNGTKLYMAFDTAKSTVSLDFKGEKMELAQQPSGSGIRYAGNGYEYEEWQGEIKLRKDGNVVFENELAFKNKGINQPSNDVGMTENFSGANGERMHVTYNTSGDAPVALVTYKDNAEKTLNQVIAWAKGGVYKNKEMTWEVNGDKGILTLGGKKIQMKKAD